LNISLYTTKKIHFSFFAFYILSLLSQLFICYAAFTTSIFKEGFNATLPHCSALASYTFGNTDNGTIQRMIIFIHTIFF